MRDMRTKWRDGGETAEQLGVELAFPREANALFLRLPDEKVEALHARGWHFYKFIEPGYLPFDVFLGGDGADIDDFVADFSAAGRPSEAALAPE